MATINNKEIVNRKARHEYHFNQEFEAGISLLGTEVKSIRLGQASMSDAYCLVREGQVILKNLYIAEYEQGNQFNHEPKRDRKLLLKRHEIQKIERRINEKGMTLFPYKIYFSERGLIKVQIVLGQGKKSYDKRNALKEKDSKRQIDRAKKLYG